MNKPTKHIEQYQEGKEYFVIGARSAWDTVSIGLYMSKAEAEGEVPIGCKKDIVRKATEQEVKTYFGL